MYAAHHTVHDLRAIPGIRSATRYEGERQLGWLEHALGLPAGALGSLTVVYLLPTSALYGSPYCHQNLVDSIRFDLEAPGVRIEINR